LRGLLHVEGYLWRGSDHDDVECGELNDGPGMSPDIRRRRRSRRRRRRRRRRRGRRKGK